MRIPHARPLLAGSLAMLTTLILGLPVASATVFQPEPKGTSTVENHPVSPQLFGMHAIKVPGSHIRGVHALRLWDTGTTWSALNPRKGVYNWAPLDEELAGAGGADITLVLGSTPKWAAETLDDNDAPWLGPGTASPPKKVADWKDYVHAVVSRYHGRIHAYQIWNEPVLSMFWRGTPEQLVELTVVAAREIRAVDPAALIVAPPMVPRQDNWRDEAAAYLAGLGAAGWPIDVFSFHGYPEDRGTPDDRVGMITDVRSLLARSGAPDLPLWETEVNYTRDTGDRRGVEAWQSAAWIARTYIDAARLGVERSYWYAWDMPPRNLRLDIRRPENLTAYATVSDWLSGATVLACTDGQTSEGYGLHACDLRDADGTTSQVMWADTLGTVSLPSGVLAKLDGTTTPVDGPTPVGPSPVRLSPPPVEVSPHLAPVPPRPNASPTPSPDDVRDSAGVDRAPSPSSSSEDSPATDADDPERSGAAPSQAPTTTAPSAG